MGSSRAKYRIVGVVFTLLLCGTQSATAQSNAQPCKMLTQAEVSAATGASVGAGQAIGNTCGWSGSPRIIVSLWYPGAAEWHAIEHPNAAVTQTAAPGIGDAAFFNTLRTFTSLGVKKGTTTFVVRIYGVAEPSKQMAIEKVLAAEVLARM